MLLQINRLPMQLLSFLNSGIKTGQVMPHFLMAGIHEALHFMPIIIIDIMLCLISFTQLASEA